MDSSRSRYRQRHALRFESLETRRLLAVDVAGDALATVDEMADVNRDGVVSPLDATHDGSTAETESLTFVSGDSSAGSVGGFGVSMLSGSGSGSGNCSEGERR